MSFKLIDNPLSYGPSQWQWPKADQKSFNIFDTVNEIDQWIDLCDGFDLAIQAGGNIGVWPLRLSQMFDVVYSFEPDPVIFDCLVTNVTGGMADNPVCLYHAALSDVDGKRVSVKRDPLLAMNYGAGYIVDGDQCSTMTIDSLQLQACNLICIDIEGAELHALKGAEETINKHHPLIVLEDKNMSQLSHFNRKVGDPGKWLIERGYALVKEVHWDSVYRFNA